MSQRIGPALFGLLLVALLVPGAALAQEFVEQGPEETLFRTSVKAFEDGDYDIAAESFLSVVRDYPTHSRSTAAWVMAGKSLYRATRFEDALDSLQAFLRAWPDSRYAPEARATIRMAEDAIRQLNQEPRDLGVVLSLSENEARQSQALFNGVLLAVEAHNEAARPENRVRLVFEEIQGDPASAAQSVSRLAERGVQVIIGGLFSDQAREAARAAEREGVVYLAPLATDEAVTRGYKYAFQANPTLSARGRLMARFAVNGLLLDDLAVVASQGDGVGPAMSDAFLKEARELGANVVLARTLAGANEWFRLGRYLPADTLAHIRGLFLPLAGRSSERLASAAMSALDDAGASVRILGNASWHDLPMRTAASRYQVTYTNDFLIESDQPETASFLQNFRDRFGADAGRLSVVGFDVGRLLLRAMNDVDDAGTVADRLRGAPRYSGIGVVIEFAGEQVNQAMFYHRYRDGSLERIR